MTIITRNFLLASILSACIDMPTLAQDLAGACHSHQGWQDSDSDRIPDIIEGATDIDGDGTANYLDEDADGDGIPDASEAYNSPAPNGEDIDGDGIDDAYDASEVYEGTDRNGDGVDDNSLPIDSDHDGTPDFLDTDSDNDGLPDAAEINTSSWFTDADTDDDGLDDYQELQLGTKPNKYDTDNGGVSDWWETYLGTDPLDGSDDHLHPGNLDVDKDGLPNDLEGYGNSDGDQIPDYLDLDSDNDGWYDIIEAGLPDSDGDGQFDNVEDANNDGLADAAAGLLSTLPDFDNDGLANTIDVDADNDGLGDAFEMMQISLLVMAGLQPLDIDGDGMPNNLDRDSDGDGILDTIEAGYPDLDQDGVADLVNDQDGDGIPDRADVDLTTGVDNIDSDGDGIADRFDTDHSVETTTVTNWSTLEQETITLPNTDIDADGIVDRHDPDHNGDGHADEYFEQRIQAAELSIDADGDGLIALRDSDDFMPFEPEPAALVAALPANEVSLPDSVQTTSYVNAFNPCPVNGVANGTPDTVETNTDTTTEITGTTTESTAGTPPLQQTESTAMLTDEAAAESTGSTNEASTEGASNEAPQIGAATSQGGSGSNGLISLLALLCLMASSMTKPRIQIRQ